jgi:TolB-like protein/Tfp pilus assembly protein PilF
MTGLRRLIRELKRRHVFRVAVVYAVVAFVIWQAAEIAVPGLSLPSWVLTLVILLTVLGFPIALVLAWALDITPEGVRRAEPARAEPAPSPSIAPPAVERKSIAVLPFANLSGDPENEYFSDGMTEEIINALTQLRDLRVAARTSSFAFKGQRIDLSEVGAKLHVATVLEGSVRKEDNRLRITAQLVEVSDGYHLWSEQYDRETEDVFAIQDDIARTIADRLKGDQWDREKEALVRPHTENLEAYSLYLKGRSHFHKFTLPDWQLTIASLQRAISLDSNYARAHEGLARVYTLVGGAGPFHLLPPGEAYPLAKAAVSKALELDDRLPEAHTTLGVVRHGFEWDWASAERAFERALELNPNDPDAHLWYAWHLWPLGRFDEAINSLTTASALDPLAPLYQSVIAQIQYTARRYDEAAEQLQKVLDAHPNFFHALLYLGDTYLEMRRFEKAEAAYQQAQAVVGRESWLCIAFCRLYAAWNKPAKAEKWKEVMLATAERTHVPPAWVGYVYMALGDRDEAFAWLEKAYEERDPQIRHLNWPWLDPLRQDPRFQALKSKMGLE